MKVLRAERHIQLIRGSGRLALKRPRIHDNVRQVRIGLALRLYVDIDKPASKVKGLSGRLIADLGFPKEDPECNRPSQESERKRRKWDQSEDHSRIIDCRECFR
jgi:hypothetical protein